MVITRNDGRAFDQARPLIISYDPFGYADASAVCEFGNTKVFVAVSVKDSVPKFLKGKNVGWLTAEYAMLPMSTTKRSMRDGSQAQKNSRGVEISRLIGRSLRSVVNLDNFGERTITIDCDVLQADGGTRVACITAASALLALAEKRWLESGKIMTSFMQKEIAAVSVGIVEGRACLDLSQSEDNKAEADFNFVLTRFGDIIEIQGTAEKAPISWEDFIQLKQLALLGIKQLFDALDSAQSSEPRAVSGQLPFFSIGKRCSQNK